MAPPSAASRRNRRFRPHRLRRWLVWWVLLLSLWLLLVASVSPAEVLLGVFVAAGVGALGSRLQGRGWGRPEPGRALRRRALRLPADLLSDTATVTLALVRALVLRQPLRGRYETITVEGGRRATGAAARRALLVAVHSLPPNTYVVDIDRGSRG